MAAPKPTALRLALGLASTVAVAAACRSETVDDAEAKDDVTFLEQTGTPEAIAALGRLADNDPKAGAALKARSYDAQVYSAAWTAVLRDAPWGAAMLRETLADPLYADLAASRMVRRDPHLHAFVRDLDGALVRLSGARQNLNVAQDLASIGPAARETVERRLVDPSTRGAMCRALVSPDADADARKALLEVPVVARDDESCVDAVVGMATTDDDSLTWLAARGETGLLGAAGKDKRLSCARLRLTWTQALQTRPKSAYPALSVPLASAVQRCSSDLDPVLSEALLHRPAARSLVVKAMDPFAFYGGSLGATCSALRSIGPTGDTPMVRERAADTLSHACGR